MPIYIRRREFGAGAASLLVAEFALASAAVAQGWPTHPVRIVVPYAPGGSTDTVARITADRLSRIWGQQVVIENKPGGGTNIAAAAVAGSDPDGYTMFIGSSSLVTSRLLYRRSRWYARFLSCCWCPTHRPRDRLQNSSHSPKRKGAR